MKIKKIKEKYFREKLDGGMKINNENFQILENLQDW